MLAREELDSLLGAGSHKALFAKSKKDAPVEPLFRQLKPFVLRDKYGESSVVLGLGINGAEVNLNDVKLARITLEPQVGGLTALSLQVQCTPDVDDMAEIFAHLNAECDIEIAFGKRVEKASSKQREMGLGFNGEEGDGEDEADDANGEASAAPTDRPMRPHENLPDGVPPIHTMSDKSKH
jgi:hypothetical protein